MVNIARILTKSELKEIGEYAKSVGFAVRIMSDSLNASFCLIHPIGKPDICVYYDINPFVEDYSFVNINWSGSSLNIEDTEKFMVYMNSAQEIAKKLLQ